MLHTASSLAYDIPPLCPFYEGVGQDRTRKFHLTKGLAANIIDKLNISGCSAVGSALGSGPRGRGFDSRHSDQKGTVARLSPFLYTTQYLLCTSSAKHMKSFSSITVPSSRIHLPVMRPNT